MKWMTRWLLLTLVLAGILIFTFGNYYLVRTEGGFHLIAKETFSLGEVVVDTRKWSPVDWLKNQDISVGLASVKWEEFKGKASSRWEKLSKDLDNQLKELDLKEQTDKAQDQMNELRKTARKKYDDLVKRLEKEDITWDHFQKKVEELQNWVSTEVDKIQKKFG